jgi:hypothetical protein
MPKSKNSKWTVVAFYEDNDQPYVAHVNATSAEVAAEVAQKGVEDGLTLRVVEVFSGHHRGRLGNSEIL